MFGSVGRTPSILPRVPISGFSSAATFITRYSFTGDALRRFAAGAGADHSESGIHTSGSENLPGRVGDSAAALACAIPWSVSTLP